MAEPRWVRPPSDRDPLPGHLRRLRRLESGGTGPSGPVPQALDDLTDVQAPSPSTGQVLTYDGTSGLWVPATPAWGGTTVVASGPTNTQAVQNTPNQHPQAATKSNAYFSEQNAAYPVELDYGADIATTYGTPFPEAWAVLNGNNLRLYDRSNWNNYTASHPNINGYRRGVVWVPAVSRLVVFDSGTASVVHPDWSTMGVVGSPAWALTPTGDLLVGGYNSLYRATSTGFTNITPAGWVNMSGTLASRAGTIGKVGGQWAALFVHVNTNKVACLNVVDSAGTLIDSAIVTGLPKTAWIKWGLRDNKAFAFDDGDLLVYDFNTNQLTVRSQVMPAASVPDGPSHSGRLIAVAPDEVIAQVRVTSDLSGTGRDEELLVSIKDEYPAATWTVLSVMSANDPGSAVARELYDVDDTGLAHVVVLYGTACHEFYQLS